MVEQANKGNAWGELQAFSLLPATSALPPRSLAPHIRLPCKVHSAAHRPRSPMTPCSLRFSMCHCGAAYMLWHCSTPTEDNIALQRARLYWFVWEFITCVPALSWSHSYSSSHSSVVCAVSLTFHKLMVETKQHLNRCQRAPFRASMISLLPVCGVFLSIMDDNHTETTCVWN